MKQAFLLLVISLCSCAPRLPASQQQRYENAIQSLSSAPSKVERFSLLGTAAKESFNQGELEEAKRYATELRDMTPSFSGHWYYGGAIQDFNVVLGRLALKVGQTEQAKNHLLAAGRTPGSPVMRSFGPNTSLAMDLLQKGERDVVIQYFDLCRAFWKSHTKELDRWTEEVRAGRIPAFGANLMY